MPTAPAPDLRPRRRRCGLAPDGRAPRRLPAGRFLRATGLPDLEALQARAVDDPAWFWGAAADDLALDWQRRPSQILDLSRRPGVGSLVERRRLQLRGRGHSSRARSATRTARRSPGRASRATSGRSRTRSSRTAVERAARAFRSLGVGSGDRVGIFLPMLPETVITVLALGLLGAIYTPIFSGYGAPAVAARLVDCEAKLLVTADGFWRRGNPRRDEGRPRTRRSPRRRRSSGSSSSGGSATARRRTSVDGGPRHRLGVERWRPPNRNRRSRPAIDRPRDAVHADLHVGHDRPAEGRRPRPRRIPDQGRPGPRPHVRSPAAATRCSGSPISAG